MQRVGGVNSTLKNDTVLNIGGYQNVAGTYVNLSFNNTILPQRTLHYLQIFVKVQKNLTTKLQVRK